MGTICTAQYEGQNYQKQRMTLTKSETDANITSRNSTVGTIELGPYANITSVFGHFSQHSTDALLAFTTLSNINFCQQLRQYAQDAQAVIEKIKADRSIRNAIKTKKSCPYQKVEIIVLPEYAFKEGEQGQIYEYHKNFRTLLRSIFEQVQSGSVYITQTGDTIIFPTQTILSLMMQELCTGLSRKCSLFIISPEVKILQMVKYQILKTQACSNVLTNWNFRALPGPIFDL